MIAEVVLLIDFRHHKSGTRVALAANVAMSLVDNHQARWP